MLDFLGDLRRTHMCGGLRASDAGSKAVLMGWVNRRRDLGNLIFVDIRDRSGISQVVFNKERNAAIHEKASGLRSEYVIAVVGTVKLRDANTTNKNIPTGEVELVAEELRLLNEAKQPPFLPGDTVLPNEEIRLKYRYLDLRRDAMQHNIELRHKIALAIRENLSGQGFFEIETPFMTRSTPEGARDYLVPSRVQPGSFYALPQSPQLFKQILMISGFDKYFQIVRCFRDEDLRADRQPEFTQIDLEMSYPQPERVWEVVEGFLRAAFKVAGHEIQTPFPRMSYDEAIRLYGSDKPDMRLPEMTDVREAFASADFEKLGVNAGCRCWPYGFRKWANCRAKSGTKIKNYSARTTAEFNLLDMDRLEKSMPEAAEQLKGLSSAHPDDLIALVGAKDAPANSKPVCWGLGKVAGAYRLRLADKYRDKHKAFERTGDPRQDFRFLWVTDFPMFEYDEEGEELGAGAPSVYFAA